MNDQTFTKYIKLLSHKEVENMKNAIGVSCDKCNIMSGDFWYERKLYIDGLVDYQTLCYDCSENYLYHLK